MPISWDGALTDEEIKFFAQGGSPSDEEWRASWIALEESLFPEDYVDNFWWEIFFVHERTDYTYPHPDRQKESFMLQFLPSESAEYTFVCSRGKESDKPF